MVISRRIKCSPLPMMIAAPSQVIASGSTPHSSRFSDTPQTSALYFQRRDRRGSAGKTAVLSRDSRC